MSRKAGRQTKARMCTGKEQMTREEAHGKARRVVRESGSFSMQAYHCRHCNHWHIGHPHKGKR